MAEAGDYARNPSDDILKQLKSISTNITVDCIRCTNASKFGCPTSCASCADILAVLLFHTMKHNPLNPRDPNNDRFILSKGHAAPVLYSAYAQLGLIKHEDLLGDLRTMRGDLETLRLDFVDVATGSLGQGLSFAAGMAYGARYLEKTSLRVFCLMGDGEMAEGSVWEAMNFASHYQLNNLVACVDVNRLGQSGSTSLGHDMDTYKRRCESFGWKTFVVDGHDIKELVRAFFDSRRSEDKPVMVLAKTFKGKGLIGIENQEEWHSKILGSKADECIKKLTESLEYYTTDITLIPEPPLKNVLASITKNKEVTLSKTPDYVWDQKIATDQAYGTALVKLATSSSRIIALDCDVNNCSHAEDMKNIYPERFIECFIAEQNAIGVAIGLSTRHRFIPFVSTYASFLTRGFDQIRVGAISQANVKFVGSHAGISVGEAGPSAMGLEDIAMFRTLPGATIFCPSDAVATEHACKLAANVDGICYIRLSRPKVNILYRNDEVFEIGKAKILWQSETDIVTVIGAGVIIHEALKAADRLSVRGIKIRVIDLFTVKPLDEKAIVENARITNGKIITLDDHYLEGGVGEAVASVVAKYPELTLLRKLAIREVPSSGFREELMDMLQIDAKAIIGAVEPYEATVAASPREELMTEKMLPKKEVSLPA